MSRPENDSSLIEACRNGDRDARRRLFLLSKDFVYSTARCFFSGDENAARDVTQDVFVKLFTSLEQFRGESAFRTWLYRMVIHACIDETRKRKRWAVPLDEDHEALVSRAPAGGGRGEESRRQLAQAVQTAVGRLSPKLKEVLLLKYFEDFSYEEIGASLGLSRGTVASRLNRGHKELARRLGHLKDELLIGD
jgi:RNA polymerase sigma-70 factor (ECF subfamily)